MTKVLLAAGAAAIAHQADVLARMARVEYATRSDGKSDLVRAQWSGIMQAARTRAIQHRTLPSTIIATRRNDPGRKWAIWISGDPDVYEARMAQLGPGTPGYWEAFALAVQVLVGLDPVQSIEGRTNFVHPEYFRQKRKPLPVWTRDRPLMIGDTLFSDNGSGLSAAERRG